MMKFLGDLFLDGFHSFKFMAAASGNTMMLSPFMSFVKNFFLSDGPILNDLF